MRVLITGGTGALAREVLSTVRIPDVTVRCTSRRPPVGGVEAVDWVGADLVTGNGLSEALCDVHTVLHTASDFTRSQLVDVDGTRRLLDAAAASGVSHLIYVSIVGIDRIPYRYYQHKLAAERLIEAGSIPYTILRATQFHSLIAAQLRAAARVPAIMPLPSSFLFQSVATQEVADRLWRAVRDGPQQCVHDFGGPDIMTLGDAARLWKTANHVTKPVVPVFIPGRTGAAFRAGANTVPKGPRGTITWREWLAAQPPRTLR